MTFTATPEPSNIPPRVLLEIDSDVVGSTFTSLTVTRNGDPILQQPALGAQTAEVYDYLAPFGQSVEYIADGAFLPFVAPDWTESWASLAAWTGSGWSLGAGDTITSTTANATITRSASGTIQRVNVTDPDYARIEVVTAGDVLVASVAVTDQIVLTGTSAKAVAGDGSFELNLTDGTATATGDVWSVTRPYTGTPTKVRVVSLGGDFVEESSFPVVDIGSANSIAIAASGNVYICYHNTSLVRKYTSAGTFVTSWSTAGAPTGIAVDSSENVYVTDSTNELVRKYTSGGTAGITWATTDFPWGIGIDSSNNIYVGCDDFAVRKFNTSGTPLTSWFVTEELNGIKVQPDGTVVTIDTTLDIIERFNSTGGSPGAGGTHFGVDNGGLLAVDASGNIWIGPASGDAVQFSNTGVELVTVTLSPNTRGAMTVTSDTKLHILDSTADTLRTFGPTTGTVGTIVETGFAATEAFREIVSTQLDVDEAWLLHPSSPSLSVSIDPGPNLWRDDGINVAIESAQSSVGKASQTLHYPIGRTRAVVIGHGNRLEDEWTLVLTAPRLEDRDAVRAIVRDQTPLLIRSPLSFGWDLPDGFYAIGDVTSDRYFAPLQFEERRITLPLVPSDPPVVRLDTERSYADLLLEAASYSDLLSMYDTYTDLLTGSS